MRIFLFLLVSPQVNFYGVLPCRFTVHVVIREVFLTDNKVIKHKCMHLKLLPINVGHFVKVPCVVIDLRAD